MMKNASRKLNDYLTNHLYVGSVSFSAVLGANAILAVSLAACKAGAAHKVL